VKLAIYLHPPKSTEPGTEDFLVTTTDRLTRFLTSRPGNATLVPVRQLEGLIDDRHARITLSLFDEAHVVMVVKRPT
jgi:hypothetical protein